MRAKQFLLTIVTGASLLGMAGCEGFVRKSALQNDARFWQRANVSDATYMEGPKTQQMLHRDISRCVVELKELERLGTLRTVIPAERMINDLPDAPTPEGTLSEWETPTRDGSLRAEFLDYTDFESCMNAKGWERMEHVPFDVAERARENYSKTILGERYRTNAGDRPLPGDTRQDDDWTHLNGN